MFTKADKERAKKYWEEDLLAEGRAEGRVEGRNEGLIIAIRSLMKTMKLSASQAMDALQIPGKDRAAYARML